nr:protein YIF1B-like [Ipomoea batatas]
MYDNLGAQPGVPIPPTMQQPNPFGNAFYGAGSGLIRGGLGAYGEKILGSSSEYVQSNISRYFSDPQYYFQVNDQYVRNKLKVVLFPFLHRVRFGPCSWFLLFCFGNNLFYQRL